MADNIEDKQIGDTFITTVGSGDPLVVVHGGPGLDHSYLVHWLSPLENSRSWCFTINEAAGGSHFRGRHNCTQACRPVH